MTDRIHLVTVDEFERFREQSENADRRLELINGEIIEKPMPTEEHGVIAANIVIPAGTFIKSRQLGRIGVEIRHRPQGDDHNDRMPDVSVRIVSKDTPVVKQGAVPQMPDFAVEIQSPDDKLPAMREKAHFYLANGCQLVWIVLPRSQQIEVYEPNREMKLYNIEDTLNGGSVLPGFTLAVRDIFDL